MRLLVEASDVTAEVEKDIEDCVEWYDGSPTMPLQDFIDRLCNTYGGEDYDLENYDNPAARRIMSIARRIRKETRA